MLKSNLPQQDTINQYVADGKTYIFNYTYLILIDSDIAVYVTHPGDQANPDKDLQILNEDYNVQNAGTMTGGTITFFKDKVPIAGSIVTLVRSMQVGIETEFGNAQTFNGHTLDAAFERIVLIMQEFNNQINKNNLQYIINSYLSSNLANKLPVLTTQDNQVWVSQGGNIITAQIENTDVSTLRSELASQAPNGGDGTHLLGYYDTLEKKGKTLQTFLNKLQSYIQYLNNFLPKIDPDGYSEGLPVYYQKGSLFFYDGDIGKIFPTVYPEPSLGELLCDGARYLKTAISQDAIPYARVAQRLWDENLGYYRSGNGVTFVSTNLDSQNQLILTTNQSGAATATSAETSGFTITSVFEGNNYGLVTFLGKNPKQILCQGKEIGAVAIPSAETSGFSLTYLRNSPAIKHLFQIECLDAKDLAGKYFNFNTTTTPYTLYMTVDGKGDDPKIQGRTSIKLPLVGTQTAEEVAIYLAECLAGHQLTSIQCLEASKIKPGSYFTFSTSTPENFHVMYGKSETLHELEGTTIPVEWIETDTAQQVAQKTKIAINQFYFAVPDLRDAFIRGWNKDGSVDIDNRYFDYGQGLIKNSIGSFQLDEIASHNHPPLFNGQYIYVNVYPTVGGISGDYYSVNISANTGDAGGS